MLFVLKIRTTHFHEKEDSKDHIKGREDNVVSNLLDLSLCSIPCRLDRSGNVTSGEAWDGE
jgi:hypothetical protein